jgi:hypothetical protein
MNRSKKRRSRREGGLLYIYMGGIKNKVKA